MYFIHRLIFIGILLIVFIFVNKALKISEFVHKRLIKNSNYRLGIYYTIGLFITYILFSFEEHYLLAPSFFILYSYVGRKVKKI